MPEQNSYRAVNQPVRKKDAMQLLLGKPVYVDDIAPKDALVVKILRSPHPNAIVQQIDTARALKVPGVVAVYTWQEAGDGNDEGNETMVWTLKNEDGRWKACSVGRSIPQM